MNPNKDPGLRDGDSARDAIRNVKSERLNAEKLHVKQEKIFLSMTGMTLQEKTFRNMIEFYMSELTEIMKAKNQSAAIRVLPKRDRITMLHNGIINGQRGSLDSWSISTLARKYLTNK